MSVMNRFMNFFGLQDEEEIIEREKFVTQEEEVETSAFEARKQQKAAQNVVSLHSQKQQTRFVLCEPRTYDESQEIADHLRSRKPVLVNLQRVRPDQAMRIVDFLSGTVYALNGNISKVGPNIFVCTPDTVEIQGTITDILAD
ncbi:cell division protein SepF [Paenibacillus gansuensis]|uniref:Cell division protein SepF n=1 Tax=Paenibacillus gansuensis TaxID=306542 RepID=A0ABW5PFS7_9BACL